MNYKKQINKLSESIPSGILDKSKTRKRGNPPTQAFSDFLTHSEQGDWAERLFYYSLKESNMSYIPVRYGRSDKITAGDPGFKDFYNKYQDELDEIGKRPDILLFNKDKYKESWGEDISSFSNDKLNEIVKNAAVGFEVRSSAYLANKFTPKKDKPNLSFTPKVEDLLVVLKWIDIFGIPHFYVQVFFDSIYIISFKDILKVLGTADIIEKGIKNKKLIGSINKKNIFVIEKNPKNQFKNTIHIFIDSGNIISDTMIRPKTIGNEKELSNGRLLHYVSFEGGDTKINDNLLINLIEQTI